MRVLTHYGGNDGGMPGGSEGGAELLPGCVPDKATSPETARSLKGLLNPGA